MAVSSKSYLSKSLATNFNFRLSKAYEHPSMDKMNVALHNTQYVEEQYH